MVRYFLVLFTLIVLTLALASWGQDRILEAYGSADATEQALTRGTMLAVAQQLPAVPAGQQREFVAAFAARSGVDLELLAARDVAGLANIGKLAHGEVVSLQGVQGQSWSLIKVDDDDVLALRSREGQAPRTRLDWLLTALFYGAIALVLMVWLWPVARDLRALEAAVAQFGNRNWVFRTDIGSRSQIYGLSSAFHRMTNRIDRLIASHKDMSHAVSHEIRTPLSRMQFSLVLAQESPSLPQAQQYLDSIRSDIEAIDQLVTATLEYAILERAEFSLNLATHDFRSLIPATVQQVAAHARADIRITADVSADASAVCCDMHLLDTVLKNLLHNALRFARSEIRVTFSVRDGMNELCVADDGPGIPEPDRLRVFDSFVQLDRSAGRKSGFGLGLAIVRRVMEWHGGTVTAGESALGGALFTARWPVSLRNFPGTDGDDK
jgi:signal transduction histidine kinase